MSKAHIVHNAACNLYIMYWDDMPEKALQSILEMLWPDIKDEHWDAFRTLAANAVTNIAAFAQGLIYKYPHENPFKIKGVIVNNAFDPDKNTTLKTSAVKLNSRNVFSGPDNIPEILKSRKLELRLIQPSQADLDVSFLKNIPENNIRVMQIGLFQPHPKVILPEPKTKPKPEPKFEEEPLFAVPGHIYTDAKGWTWLNLTDITFYMRQAFRPSIKSDPNVPEPTPWSVFCRQGEFAYLRWTGRLRADVSKSAEGKSVRPSHILKVLAQRSPQPWTSTSSWYMSPEPKIFVKHAGAVMHDIPGEEVTVTTSWKYDPSRGCFARYEFKRSTVPPENALNQDSRDNVNVTHPDASGNIKTIFRE